MAELPISSEHADGVRRILWAHLPRGAKVSAFGSRATGRGLKPHSDLDLLIDSPFELPTATLADLREALAELDLPFSVALLDRRDASAEFLSRLEAEGVVELRPLPAELGRTLSFPGLAMVNTRDTHGQSNQTQRIFRAEFYVMKIRYQHGSGNPLRASMTGC